MIPRLAADVLLYVLAVVLFCVTVSLTLRSTVPPWPLNPKELFKRTPDWKPPAWAVVTIAGLGISGVLTIMLDTAAPVVVQSRYEPVLAAVLCLLTVLTVRDQLGRTPGRVWAKIGVVTAGMIAAGTIVLWSIYPNWLTADVLSIFLGVWYLYTLQPLWNFWYVAATLFLVALCYDVVETLATSSMINAADKLITVAWPGIIRIPLHITSLASAQGALIGAGDILIPGVLGVVAGRIAQRSGDRSILWAAFGGFAVSLLLALIAVIVFSIPQPATIFTVPGVTLPVAFAARRHGIWEQLKIRQRPGDKAQPKSPPAAAEPEH